MHRLTRPIAVLIASLAFAGAAQAQSLSVGINQAERVSLPGTARDVVVGNPMIADVSVIDGRTLVLTGKSYGVTNLLVLDGRGRAILDRQVVVSAPDSGRVSVYRGRNLQSFTCNPSCNATTMNPTVAGRTADVGGDVPDQSSGE